MLILGGAWLVVCLIWWFAWFDGLPRPECLPKMPPGLPTTAYLPYVYSRWWALLDTLPKILLPGPPTVSTCLSIWRLALLLLKIQVKDGVLQRHLHLQQVTYCWIKTHQGNVWKIFELQKVSYGLAWLGLWCHEAGKANNCLVEFGLNCSQYFLAGCSTAAVGFLLSG